MFIATANVAETIPGPLLDRMEVIRFDGYTTAEKTAIARGYLWPRQRERNGLLEDEVTVSDELLTQVVMEYTREAGVRNLERELGTILRKTATQHRVRQGDRAGRDHDGDRPRRARPPEGLAGGGAAHGRPGRGHRPRGDRYRRRRAVHRGDGHEGQGRPGPDRPAGRRDEGVGADRALLRPRPRRGARHRRRRLRGPRVPRAHARGRDPEGRPERRRDHGHGARRRCSPAAPSSTRSA